MKFDILELIISLALIVYVVIGYYAPVAIWRDVTIDELLVNDFLDMVSENAFSVITGIDNVKPQIKGFDRESLKKYRTKN